MPQKTEDTPMMRQYKAIKNQYPDAYLFFRLGDFYELFYEDAEEVAQVLELTLTSRNKKADDPIPMCGVPYHSADAYIKKLVDQGHKVAICEQVEDPKTAKGMVKREVVQLVTPGTVMEEGALKADENNYLSTITQLQGKIQLATVDLSTGELRATELNHLEALLTELASLDVREVILCEGALEFGNVIQQRLSPVISQPRSEGSRDYSSYYDDSVQESIQAAVNYLLQYLSDTQMRSLDHIQALQVYQTEAYLRMGPGARKNLELHASLKDQSKKGTLLWLLDETQTAMGGRLLKQWLDKPLVDEWAIQARLDQVENLIGHFFERTDLSTYLKKVYDLERLAGRISFQTVNARDLIQLKDSLSQIPSIIQIVRQINDEGQWNNWLDKLDACQDLMDLIDQAILDDPPLTIMEGGFIKMGYDDQLDQYLSAMHNGKQWIAALQQEEREKTGIKNLKIGFNKVFGYFIEVTKANVALVDEDRYERKQTLTNAERYITPELKEKERLILEAEDKSKDLEYQLFVELREEIKEEIDRIQSLAKAISRLDALASFAEVAERYHFVRPTFHQDSQTISIQNGRHPVVEKVLGDQTYVPNDVEMGPDTDILLITGPNMSGKSTYMRQLALIVIMAQMGSFVPAQAAQLPLFDQIYTRIGAMDDLIGGQSTFMVEMMEANTALQEATQASLLLFDEIGRGTATFDGMALAEAIIQYIHDEIGAKTLFSTHYHELTDLKDKMARLKNVHVGAVEDQNELVFLHKIEDGPADQSYGVQVAKLAGLPAQVIENASSILAYLSQESETGQVPMETASQVQEDQQLTLFESDRAEEEDQVLDQLKGADLSRLTPIEAMNLLYTMQGKLLE